MQGKQPPHSTLTHSLSGIYGLVQTQLEKKQIADAASRMKVVDLLGLSFIFGMLFQVTLIHSKLRSNIENSRGCR
jgi:hypothetical protein